MSKPESIKTFIHKFTDGQTIKLTFDFSKPMPYCESNLQVDKQPASILAEFRKWQETVVLPEVMNRCSPEQIVSFIRYGQSKRQQN